MKRLGKNVPHSWDTMSNNQKASYLTNTYQVKNYAHGMRLVEQEQKERERIEQHKQEKLANVRLPYADN